MSDKQKARSSTILKRRAYLSAAGVVIASVFAFGAIDFFYNIILGINPSYDPIPMIGMIGPMGVLMGFVSWASWRATNRYTTKLLVAMEKVSDSDFGVRLDASEAGPYVEVFDIFNTMCEELQGVQSLRDDFINHFSHEFKTPITSISGFARLLLEERVSDEERKRYLEIIASESERLAEMSTRALLISKLDSQQYIVDKEPYALDEQIKRCAILLSPQWTKKCIDLSAELESTAYTGNADLMEQLWLNLLGNAIKYTPERGTISINLRKDKAGLIVSISDTGRGMTQEELGRCFEKYYQGESSQASKGLGLGLAIVKRILELSGGSIEASSVLGQGSVFAVRLPTIG